MGWLQRTTLALDEMKQHQKEIQVSPLLESYFSQYLLVSFCSEMEENVKAIVKRRVHISQDEKLAPFFHATIDGILHRIKKTEISDVVKKFGRDIEEMFENKLVGVDINSYSNAIANRQLVAHASGVAATFIEVEKAIVVGNVLLEALEESIQ